MNSVFLLWYVRDEGKNDEDKFLIGAYSTDSGARDAIERLKGKPGFVDAPEGFQICPYELNRDHWTEGFIFTD
jgi:hypothetical protein